MDLGSRGRYRVLFTPENLDIISTGPCIWQSLVGVWVLPEEYSKIGFFWEMTSRKCFPIQRNAWFDSGNMFVRQSTEAFGRISHIFYVKVDLGSRGRCRVLFTPENLYTISTGHVPGLHFLRECGFGVQRNFPNMFSYSALCLVRRQ